MIDLKNKILPLKVIFWGYHWSGWQTYCELKQSPVFKIVGIVLPINRQHETIDNIKTDAKNLNIPVFEPSNLSDELFVSALKKLSADLHFVDSYSKLIPKKVIEITGLGFNLHPGLLPQYRGAHVLNWVLVNGEKETGLSLHLLTDKFDEGAVICYEKEEILITDTAADLDKKLIKKIPALIKSLEQQIKRGKIEFQKQEGIEHHWPARSPKDGEINIKDSALQAYNKIRAVSYPWLGAFLMIDNVKLVIWQASLSENKSEHKPGILIEKRGELYYVAADQKLVSLRSVNVIGKDEYNPIQDKAIIEMVKKAGVRVISE